MDSPDLKPLIFDIHHFSHEDGPGIRTTVFMKGCPLRCSWCHNPESVRREKELAFYTHKCRGCGECVITCGKGAIDLSSPERINRDICSLCGKCADECTSGALRLTGRYYTPSELSEILLRDIHYYETSKGGVTFSGGEPALHMDYLSIVMQQLKRKGIHIAIQTCGMFSLTEFEKKILPYTDIIYYDIKITDPYLHNKFTGSDNRIILENFKSLLKKSQTRKNFTVISRTPVIPGVNDSYENISELKNFYKNLNHSNYTFLRYNPGGEFKLKALGRKNT